MSPDRTPSFAEFLRQGPISLHDDPLLQRQAARESNARAYPRHIPLALRQANGIYLRDTQGQLFMNCLAGAGTLALGHNHDAAISAMCATLDSGLPLHTLDLTTPVKDSFIEALLSSLPADFGRRGRIPTDGRDKVPPGPEMLPHAVALALPVHPRQMNRALSFDEPHHL